jgi:hypothetical protein
MVARLPVLTACPYVVPLFWYGPKRGIREKGATKAVFYISH